jgi:hypothetical protein
LCDKADEIIDLHSSLLIGSAKKIVEKNNLGFILSEQECQTLIDEILFISNLEYDISEVIRELKFMP